MVTSAIFVFNGRKTTDGTITVERSLFVNQVSVSGKVETESIAQLGFASSGRLASVFVKNNESVKQGQILAQLEIGDLIADLRIKEANSKTSDVDLESVKDKLQKVTSQENAKVANVYRNLLSEDLELIPESADYTATPPNITGVYDGQEGNYKINIGKENVTSSDLFFVLSIWKKQKTK